MQKTIFFLSITFISTGMSQLRISLGKYYTHEQLVELQEGRASFLENLEKNKGKTAVDFLQKKLRLSEGPDERSESLKAKEKEELESIATAHKPVENIAFSALCVAITRGYMEIATQLVLKLKSVDKAFYDENCSCPLGLATATGNISVVGALLDKNPDKEFLNKFGFAPRDLIPESLDDKTNKELRQLLSQS